MDKIMDGKALAEQLKEELKEKINNIKKKLKLVVIQVGNNEASNVYVNKKRKLCAEMNIDFEHLHFEETTNEGLIEVIDQLNTTDDVTGIIVQLPLPAYLDETRIIEAIDPIKDVDGLTSYNLNNLVNKKQCIVPCTTLGILKILAYYNIEIDGKDIVIVGRSRLVGIPTLISLLNENATVTVCHSKTKNLQGQTKKADILIAATGKKHLITKDMIKDNAILIDVGITREDKLYGDINYDDVIDKCQLITPVPGGIGPMTTIMLINNIVECAKLQG